MPNFFTDNPDLVDTFHRLDLADVVEMLERGFVSSDDPLAPANYDEAVEQHEAALQLVGDIAGNFIAPRAADIDLEGARLVDGEVHYAPGSWESYQRLAEAGMAGVIIPRRFGGLNFPATIYIMMVEMVSRADAAMQTMFGYQDVGEAIAHLGTEDIAKRFLPGYCDGSRIGAMVLTEPGGGSDLARVRVKAFQDDEGTWRLRGTKQFISNGNGQMLLVLARSEEGTDGMFGLSLFACEGGEGVTVARLEEKMGLHGSPTCELVFDDAEAFLVGKRRSGLLHVLHILNHARYSVAAQGLGIAQGAYEAAYAYAHEREAFGDIIYRIPAVADLLIDMQVSLEACRALTYTGAQWLDRRNRLEVEIEHRRAEGRPTDDHKAAFKQAAALTDFLSPAVKYLVTEEANRICYLAQQVHGGMGYMQEMPLERMVRDVRITTIYEGTTQVMVGASLAGVRSRVLDGEIDELAAAVGDRFADQRSLLDDMSEAIDEGNGFLDGDISDAERAGAARGMVDAYLHLYAGWLLLEQALTDDRKGKVAARHIAASLAKARSAVEALRLGVHRGTVAPDEICR